MDTKIDDGGSAFPLDGPSKNGDRSLDGMTLRDYFAAKALGGYLFDTNPDALMRPDFEMADGVRLADRVATYSYAFADAMLKARKEGAQ